MRPDDLNGRLASVITDVSRELSQTMPAPKAAPYFGLDNDRPYDLATLEALSTPGIFRKYELVLLLGSGLGGTARWLSVRLGCRVLGLDHDTARVAAAEALNRRARTTKEVSFVVADPERLALRDRVFTHVWLVDPQPGYRTQLALSEAYRVLRTGAHFALQTCMPDHDSTQLERQLLAAGFVDVRSKRATLKPPTHAMSAASAKMMQRLAGDEDLKRLWAGSWLTSDIECRRIFCRRP